MKNIIEKQLSLPNGIVRELKYDLDNGRDIARWVARERYAWPGGYELVAVTADGASLCGQCCWDNYREIAEACRSGINNGWQVAAFFSTASYDGHICCDHCNRVVQERE